MANVLKMDKQQLIKGLVDLGWSNRRIHRETGINRRTIAKYRWRFQNAPESLGSNLANSGQQQALLPKATACGLSTSVRPCRSSAAGHTRQNAPEAPPTFYVPASQNAPLVPIVSEEYPTTKSEQVAPYLKAIYDKSKSGLTAQRIYQDLVEEEGYQGGYDAVKRYAHKLKDIKRPYFERLQTRPGEEAQVDFGSGPLVKRKGKYRRAWLFKMTMGFSRHSYEELVWDQKLETFIRCHEHAFKAFGGVPTIIRLDNIKSGVLKACLYDPILHPVYEAFAAHWGFVSNPCAPYSPHHKGKVERNIGYTKSNALKNRRFESLEEGNAFLHHWNKRWARTRIHGSTKRQVWQQFVEYEKPALRSLAERDFPYFEVGDRLVDCTGYIQVDNAYYQVPAKYIGRRLDVHYNSQYVKVLHQGELIVCHKTKIKGKHSPVPAFAPYAKPISLQEQEEWYGRKAKRVGAYCAQLVRQILELKGDPLAIRRVRGILSLAKRYEAAIVERACEQALITGVTLMSKRYANI